MCGVDESLLRCCRGALAESESKAGEWHEKSKPEAVAFLRRAWKSLSPQVPRPCTRKNNDFPKFLLGGRGQASLLPETFIKAWETLEAGRGERGRKASPLAGKVFSTLFLIETGTEQITMGTSCCGGAGVVHLMTSQRIGVGDREGKGFCLHQPGAVRGQGSPAVSSFL